MSLSSWPRYPPRKGEGTRHGARKRALLGKGQDTAGGEEASSESKPATKGILKVNSDVTGAVGGSGGRLERGGLIDYKQPKVPALYKTGGEIGYDKVSGWTLTPKPNPNPNSNINPKLTPFHGRAERETRW